MSIGLMLVASHEKEEIGENKTSKFQISSTFQIKL
jgi:hypothetical protein